MGFGKAEEVGFDWKKKKSSMEKVEKEMQSSK